MTQSSETEANATTARERILCAAFEAFTDAGYAATSTLDIARRARVSKRDLYANFGSKQAVLAACIKSRAARMQLLPNLPSANDRQMLAAILTAFGTNLIREISDPMVITAFRLAIAEASRTPELAETLESAGRNGARAALAKLLIEAQEKSLLDAGDPTEMAAQFFGLLWEGLMVSLLLGVADAPLPEEAVRRAGRAAAAFMRLHPAPPADS